MHAMDTRNIIVIGASAGGFAVLRQLAADLPPNLPAALFIVWHMPPDAQGLLSQVLNRAHTLPAADAVDGEAIVLGRIYVAPPDHHLLLEPSRVRVTKGPKEHRFRPAVDPLFRSAAWTAPISPDHCERVLVVRSVKAFVLTWRQVAQARMEPLLIIHVIDEAPNLSLGIGERLVVIEIDLLDSLNANDKTVAVARHG